MKMKRHCNRITFQTAMYHVSGFQKLKIHKQDMWGMHDLLFEGKYSELDARENRPLKDQLEYMELGTVSAEGDTLIIGVRE